MVGLEMTGAPPSPKTRRFDLLRRETVTCLIFRARLKVGHPSRAQLRPPLPCQPQPFLASPGKHEAARVTRFSAPATYQSTHSTRAIPISTTTALAQLPSGRRFLDLWQNVGSSSRPGKYLRSSCWYLEATAAGQNSRRPLSKDTLEGAAQ